LSLVDLLGMFFSGDELLCMLALPFST